MSIPFQHPFQDGQFDIFTWYPKFQSCLNYFLNHGQHSQPVQTVAAFVNIQLPFQKAPPTSPPQPHVTLVPYIRRLIVTGHDTPTILHGFFGDDWITGVGPIHEIERRNYLFAAKSVHWLFVKDSYDMADGQTVPFMQPLQNVTQEEIDSAEASWSAWLAMQDWMLGPMAPPNLTGYGIGRDRSQQG